MKKKIILYLMVLFLGAPLFTRAAFAKPTLYAYAWQRPETNNDVCQIVFDIVIVVLNFPPPPVTVGSLFINFPGMPPAWKEIHSVVPGVNKMYNNRVSCSREDSQKQEQYINNSQMFIRGFYYDYDYGSDYVSPHWFPVPFDNSNFIRLVNSVNAPLGSTFSPPSIGYSPPAGSDGLPAPYVPAVLTPPDLMTLTKDPINIATGEAYFSSTDFSLNARGPNLALFRKYRSYSKFNGMFGYGWRTDFDINLSVDGSGNVTIFDGEGTGIYFMKNSLSLQQEYTPSPGNYSTLTKNADNTFTLINKNGNISKYGITGRLTSVTDRNGNVLTFVYNPAQAGGTYIQDASGRKIVFSFDSNGHIILAKSPAGKTFQYGYDVNGNLVSIIDPTGAVSNYDYDNNHKIVQFTNANGHKSYFQYDAQGRAIMNWQNNNVNKVTLDYQANNTTVTTDSLGNKNTYVFNDYGLLTDHTDPLGAVTKQTWDFLMNKTSTTDARNNVTSFAYDGLGNLVQITDPLNNQTRMTYASDFNLIDSKIDALGKTTKFAYDSKGNPITVTDALGNNHSFAYDQYGNVMTATDSLGHNATFTYNDFGHVLQKTDALGNPTKFTYE